MNAINGKPIKAFMEQNHQAHIQVHMMAMQDPKMAQIIGQNPQAQAIQAAMMAHINEHIAFEYRREMEQRMGIILPNEDQTKALEPQMADQIAQMAAGAAQELFKQNSQEVQQQQFQQQMQDPVVQMQMQELKIKEAEVQLKAQKQQIDAAAKADQIRIEESRIAVQKEIAAMQVAANTAAQKDKLARQQESEGMRIGADIAKHRAQMSIQQAQRAARPNAPNKKGTE
jgi:hypothetical protein